MTEITVSSYPAHTRPQTALQGLTPAQLKFIKEFVYRFDHNWNTGELDLNIRLREFSEEDFAKMLFLFPHARARGKYSRP